MAEIKNIETLQAEISRLKAEVSAGEQRIREHATDFRESLKPANLLSSWLKSIIGDPEKTNDKSFIRKAIKKGLFSLIGNIFSKESKKEDEHTPGIIDRMFEKIKDFIDSKRRKKKESKYYKFDDDYDSESN